MWVCACIATQIYEEVEMGWTEERVELLKKLWADGLSASQIAGRLGEVTRNAVIGKVHRLGLAGRATTSRVRSARPRNRVSHLPLRPTRVQYRTHGNVALKPIYSPMEQPTVALSLVPSVLEETDMPAPLKVVLLDLKENSCRWPIGDPQDENFYFCGHEKKHGGTYCDHHAKVAFQPAARRKK
jgi:GcrA cell cycle regulator